MRRKRVKKGPNGCLIAVAVVLVLVLVAAAVGYFWVSNEIKGNRGSDTQAEILIEMGSGPLTIGRQLQEAGVIRSAQVFRLYVRQKDVADTLQYGRFTFDATMSYDAIVEALQTKNTDRETVTVTFPEGIPAVQFAQRMEEAGLCTAQEFLDVANNGDFSQYGFWAKRDINENAFMQCEGFLFPDTYEFFKDDDVYNMVSKIYGEFDAKVSDEMYARMDEMGLNLSQFVTLASIVQEEAGNVVEQANVAAVFWNRLQPGSPVGKLESNCASYIQSDNDNNYIYNTIAPYYGGWDSIPQNIIDNYDTYSVDGLPAGPISNPGMDAMMNTLHYTEESPYYFFVTDKNGKYYYGITADDHAANVAAANAANNAG